MVKKKEIQSVMQNRSNFTRAYGENKYSGNLGNYLNHEGEVISFSASKWKRKKKSMPNTAWIPLLQGSTSCQHWHRSPSGSCSWRRPAHRARHNGLL